MCKKNYQKLNLKILFIFNNISVEFYLQLNDKINKTKQITLEWQTHTQRYM